MRPIPRMSALVLLALSAMADSVRSQPAVRTYPDPGYRQLGVYGGGDERYFDYNLNKISVGDSFPDKAAWWAGLKSRSRGPR